MRQTQKSSPKVRALLLPASHSRCIDCSRQPTSDSTSPTSYPSCEACLRTRQICYFQVYDFRPQCARNSCPNTTSTRLPAYPVTGGLECRPCRHQDQWSAYTATLHGENAVGTLLHLCISTAGSLDAFDPCIVITTVSRPLNKPATDWTLTLGFYSLSILAAIVEYCRASCEASAGLNSPL